LKNKVISYFKVLILKAHYSFKLFIAKNQEKSFIKHNKKIWGEFKLNRSEPEVLVEATLTASTIISFSYLANFLASKYSAKIRAYVIEKKRIRAGIYESFNADVFHFSLSESQSMEVAKLFNEIYPNLKTKRDVENLEVGGVWVGDLLYDSHLRKWLIPTVDMNDNRFHTSLKEALGYYVYWRDYLDSHHVKAVIVTHCVYAPYAIILRVAIQRGIPGYQVNATSIFLLNEENIRAYTEFHHYSEEFRKLPLQEQQRGLKASKEKLERRFAGEVGVDMRYSTKSAFVRSGKGRVLVESPRIKVLVATHCFFDSPHPYGVALFPDFYEWMTFLGEISEKTDYDWYLKMHPDFLPGNKPIIAEFVKKYPKFTLLPSEISHLQIIEEGIDFGLTVAGTIGFEYAALGVPVINGATCNPHVAYNFNFHPRSIEEYERLLMDLPNQKLDIDVNEVYEYYYMAFIDNVENWLFSDYNAFLDQIGGYKKQVGPISYKKFMQEFSKERHEQILSTVRRFVESKEYRLRKRHLSRESEVRRPSAVAK